MGGEQGGERVSGEWLLEAHGTRYNLTHEAFVVFDILVKHERLIYHEFLKRVSRQGFTVPNLLHMGQPLKLDRARKLLGQGAHGAIDEVEGFVYRCEREGKVDFLCKWVRPDKEDGKYLDQELWNVNPEQLKIC